MLKTPTTPLGFLFLLLCFPFHGSSQVSSQEHATLLKLKQHWKNLLFLTHWTSSSNSSSHCGWPEIRCDENNAVTKILLSNLDLTEIIPSFICDFKNLLLLDLQFNYIPGGFPTVLYNCSKLQYLDLSQNYFVGQIPSDIYRLTNLTFLSLTANNFSGDIPASIGRLSRLQTLSLVQNRFNGSFPAEIGNLYDLEVLELSYNGFLQQAMPSSFTNLKKLKSLWISLSNLIGNIPETIGDMVALEHLDLSQNGLTGSIPISLFSLKNLNFLYLYKNRLTGEIPSSLQFFNLREIDFSANNLNGTIPGDFGKLNKLELLSLFMNRLSGQIPESIGRLPNLKNVKFFSNNLSGVIPPDFGRYSLLETIQVADNMISGALPEYLCSGGSLMGMVAFNNNLTQELPKWLDNCSTLQVLWIDGNKLSGPIPTGLWFSNLSSLIISDNLLSGELPPKFPGGLSRLQMSNNMFSGQIPSGISSARNLAVFEASNNLFNGTIPKELASLPNLITLSLDRNQLAGQIPSEINSWKSIITLNLSKNKLSGTIPIQIASVPHLIYLDLSENHFSGQIPANLANLRLALLNLSSNNLSGNIPMDLESKAYQNSFDNNPQLCSSKPSQNLNSCFAQPTDTRSSRVSHHFIAVTFGIVVAIFILAFVLLIFMIRAHRRRKEVMDPTWKLTSFQRLNFTDADILQNLTESNIIGSGGSGTVYRASVGHSGDLVAVKKIQGNWNIDKRVEKEFLAEVETLSAIRHSNIVKLLCCVYSENSKLLVYEYMENRSLDQWLHGRRVKLDWVKRMKIAVGVAQGLCYLHHHCSPPIIHRDVKSSNILLDSRFNPKIADFGLARVLVKQGQPKTMSAVAGTLGYMAPEYGQMARVNEKVDVFGLGVVLLELATGREAGGGGGEHGSLVEWAYCQVQQGGVNSVFEALDSNVKEGCYLEEMSDVFKLGIVCTLVTPSARPTSKEVLQVLLQCIKTQPDDEKNVANERDVAPLLRGFFPRAIPNHTPFISIV